LTVTTVVNAPRTVVTRINVTFIAIAHNIVQPNQSFTGTVDVANEPTDMSSCMVNSSSSSNNNNNSCTTANFNDNLGKPGNADMWATSHLGTEDWLTRVGQLGNKCKFRTVFFLSI